jgi:glycine dehydrogenase subunit 2
LSRWLSAVTGMQAVAMTPKGRRARRADRHDGHQSGARGARREALRSAGGGIGARHQPATAALLGYRVETVPARADGTVDPEEVTSGCRPTSPPSC